MISILSGVAKKCVDAEIGHHTDTHDRTAVETLLVSSSVWTGLTAPMDRSDRSVTENAVKLQNLGARPGLGFRQDQSHLGLFLDRQATKNASKCRRDGEEHQVGVGKG